MFMTGKEKEILKALDGLIAPCDAELNVYGGGYTLKTGTLEDLATAAMFFRDGVNGKKNALTSHIVVEVDTSKISELVREAQECIDRAVEDIRIGLFTDGGTSKEPIKIPEDKYWGFVNSLRESSKKKIPLSNSMYIKWNTDGEYTKCFVEYHGVLYIGNAIKHPDDVENEYIGKSLSFNRAFDKLEKAVLKAKANRDYDKAAQKLQEILHGYYGGHIEDSRIDVRKSVAGFDFATGEIIYMDTDSCLWKPKIKPKTKSESMPNLTPIHDDITITMSQDDAKELREHLGKQKGIAYSTFHELGIKLGLVKR